LQFAASCDALGLLHGIASHSIDADYRQFDGVYLPFKETMYRDCQKMADREYTERKINSGVKPEIFARPAG